MRSIVDHKMLPALYEFLKATRPFRAWGLPHADDVEFGVLRLPDRRGDYACARGSKAHRIRISSRLLTFTERVVETMAHEMIHLHLQQEGCQESDHGATFKKRARQVCRIHGFDPTDF